MTKVITFFLFALIFCLNSYAQQKPYGYKLPFNGEFMSTAFIIQDGFVLDSATYGLGGPNRTFRFEYDDHGKLKRDINYRYLLVRVYDTTSRRFKDYKQPGTRDYYYNEQGNIDSVTYGHFTWDTNEWVSDSLVDHFSYSNNGKIISKINSNKGTIISIIENNYDSTGNLIFSKSSLNNGFYFDTTYTNQEYDLLNRLMLTTTVSTSYKQQVRQTIYQYDSKGNVSWFARAITTSNAIIIDTSYSQKFCLKFDETDKASVETKWWYQWSVDGDTVKWFDESNFIFIYNEFNMILSIGESATTFHYNAVGNLDSITNFYPDYSVFSVPTLVDAYGNNLVFSNEVGGYKFYYSLLSTEPPTEPTMRIPCTSLNFGNIKKDSSKSISFQVTNTSLNPLVIDSIYTLTGNFAPQTENAVVNQGTPLTLTVQLTPDTIGFYSDTLYLKNNSAKPLIKIPVAGKSPFPQLKVSPASLEFGQVKKDSMYQKQIALMDSSVNTLQIDSIYTVTKYFNLINSLTSNVIAKTDTAYLTIGFAPDSAGSYFDTLFIVSNSPVSLKRVPLTGNALITSVQKNDEIPHSYALNQNYPNPFNPTTTIVFSLPSKSSVVLTIVDILGRTVAVIVDNETLAAGNYSKQWNASGYASGIYFYRLQAGTFAETKKLMLLR